MEVPSNTDPRRLYNVKEFSDVKLFIPGLGKLGPSRSIIYAHKVILAAGSEFLRSEFLRPSSTVSIYGDRRKLIRLLMTL
jgi:hypothetical protein